MTWYVAETQWRMEREVCKRLTDIDVQTMLPMIREGAKTFPMFLCYVFLRSPRANVRGVRQVLGSPTALPPAVAERMAALCETENTVEDVLPALFSIGDSVKVIAGPMQGLVGKILKSNRVRVGLLLSVLGRDTEIQVPAQLVAAA